MCVCSVLTVAKPNTHSICDISRNNCLIKNILNKVVSVIMSVQLKYSQRDISNKCLIKNILDKVEKLSQICHGMDLNAKFHLHQKLTASYILLTATLYSVLCTSSTGIVIAWLLCIP